MVDDEARIGDFSVPYRVQLLSYFSTDSIILVGQSFTVSVICTNIVRWTGLIPGLISLNYDMAVGLPTLH